MTSAAQSFLSPRFHARGTSGATSVLLGGEEEAPANARPEQEPVPFLAVCSRCRSAVRHNPSLKISFCEVHGFVPFAFIPTAQTRFRRA